MAAHKGRIHLGLNDSSSGRPSGHARRLQVLDADGDSALSLLAIEPEPACSVDGLVPRLRLGCHRYHLKGHRPWAGDWSCDGVLLQVESAIAVLNEAHASGWEARVQ